MSITYTYEIINVDPQARCMEIVYRSEGRQTMHIGARLPYQGETLEAIVQMYAPIAYWQEQEAQVIVPEVGAAGEIAPLGSGPMTLESAKAAKKRQIEAERDAACEQPVTALGRTWDADKRSQELLTSVITLAQAGAPLPTVWRDYDNNNMPVTSIADLLAISGAIAAQVQQAYATSWMRKAAVDAATTIEEVNAV